MSIDRKYIHRSMTQPKHQYYQITDPKAGKNIISPLTILQLLAISLSKALSTQYCRRACWGSVLALFFSDFLKHFSQAILHIPGDVSTYGTRVKVWGARPGTYSL